MSLDPTCSFGGVLRACPCGRRGVSRLVCVGVLVSIYVRLLCVRFGVPVLVFQVSWDLAVGRGGSDMPPPVRGCKWSYLALVEEVVLPWLLFGSVVLVVVVVEYVVPVHFVLAIACVDV